LYKNIALLFLVLVLVLNIPACSSIMGEVSTLTNPGLQEMIEPTLKTTPIATVHPGTSQSNPVPVGSVVIVDNMKFVITGAVRPADGIVSSGDMFNAQPGEYQQYIFVTLTVACETSTDQLCRLNIFKMKLLGSGNLVKYPERLLSGVGGILVSTDFNQGETISGNIPFIINIGASHLELVYESLSGDFIYLALP
jgi:hypothetical protein